MSADSDVLVVRELSLEEIEPGGTLHAEFLRVHTSWTSRGVSRWLSLLRVDGPHPTVVFGALLRGRLVGAVVGLWGPMPLTHFDDLFDHAFGATVDRPRHGMWHLVAVTTDPDPGLRGLGIGRELLGAVLAWAASYGFEQVVTLSPAIGLRELAASWPGDTFDAIATSARPDGRPVLPILRLHLGGGAVLERVLIQSRRDDDASDHVTLRFLYATAPGARRARRAAWSAWCDERAFQIANGRAQRLGPELFRVVTPRDAAVVWPEPEPSGSAPR